MKAAAAVAVMATLAGSAQGFQWTYKGEEHTGKLTKTMNPTICDPNVKQYAGRYEIDQGTKSYFYWAFEARNKSKDTPTILWMTGGPGCSSELALLFENGPCHANEAGTGTVNNPYSWNSNANLVYIDQPAGVGFSEGKMNDKDEAMVAADMYAFLQALFKDHPDWNTEFYVFGESYGGHYAPATAHKVWQGGQAGEGIKINLAGLGVGNGLTDPEVQYKYYGQQGFNWSTTVQGHPVFTLQQYEQMQSEIPACIAAIKSCNNGGGDQVCINAQSLCNADFLSPYTATGLNPYDITKKCAVPPLCYNFTNIDTYLNSAELQQAIGVNKKWESCNYQVNADFAADWMHNFQDQVPDLLTHGVRVLIYAGDYDYVCNWIGNKAWTMDLAWPGKAGFNAATDNAWTVAGKTAGRIRSHAGFNFLQVHAAGHMVPADQPEAALQMVNSFVFNKPF
eukprot:Rhum_TRINITY_DN16872_c0_g1::Rhum_TRINITY_DN16872_c0_g1_i1::g.164734::m.164734